MPAFAESLDLLWKLRAHDEPIVAAQHEIARQKSLIDQSRGKLASAQAEVARARADLEGLRRAERDDEAELKRLEQRIAMLEAQMGSSTSEAQLKNVTAGLDKERRLADDLETRSLERLDDIEAVQKRLDGLRGDQAAAEAALAQVEREALAVMAAQQAIVAEHEAARAALSQGLEEGLLAQYETAHRQNPGSALAAAKAGNCTGCFGELTQQQMSEIRARTHLVRCPHCHRLLDWRE
ncbi:MAG: hypothetical protein HUU03_03565 [Planctomycetaceae bacterium]|nr:hypothetical protein [Planctomycetota bacterium]NUO15502.1 hypothetical protein [Planctomycetaceae bacterium]GIK51248.1 MAG: hypothetical protein BroJett014_02210 [Planctomycetota bacterium]